MKPSHLLHLHCAVVDLIFELDQFAEFALHVRGEWDLAVRAGSEIEFVQFSIDGNDYRTLARDSVAWKRILRAETFLIVTRNFAAQPTLAAGFEIAHAQARDGIAPGGVEQLLAVGREHGAQSAAVFRSKRIDLAAIAVVALHLPLTEFGVVSVPARHCGEVDIFTIGRKCGASNAACTRVGWTLGDLNPAPAILVEQPKFGSAKIRFQRISSVAPHGDVLPIGRPRRRTEHVLLILGDGARFGPIGIHDPDVVAASAVADEYDLLAVRRVARLIIPFHSGSKGLERPARDRQSIKVTEHIDKQRFAIGRYVNGHPGSFIGIEFDGAFGFDYQRLGLRAVGRILRGEGAEQKCVDGK